MSGGDKTTPYRGCLKNYEHNEVVSSSCREEIKTMFDFFPCVFGAKAERYVEPLVIVAIAIGWCL